MLELYHQPHQPARLEASITANTQVLTRRSLGIQLESRPPRALSQEALISYFLDECFHYQLNTNKQETRFSGVYILEEQLTISSLPRLHVHTRVK